MYLKSIELVGFKSFANKTYIDLKEGVTGIVGPNGCGKSNIVDAFRWCLGEMSAKSLRSKQMLDVIFAGSSGKAAMNLSEVTLTFDNSHHILPIDFTEVQVTRRLFRSGESEYFLNKTQCRLKDIRDLFLDTGIGEGYSILAQGEVDFVINAKPEERRELFEEAAGISKYKARREETLRKLEKVDMDLSRLSDIVSLTKEQMDSLESAAKKAQSYQKLKAELKVLEVTDYLNQMSRLEEEIQDKQKKIDQFKQEILEATTALDKSEADLTQNRIQQDQCDKELFERNTALLHLDKEIDHSDQMLKVSKERESEFREKEKKTQEQIELDRVELKNIEAKLETVKAELSRSQKEAEELQSHFEKEKETWKSLESERNTFDNSKRKLSDLILKLAGDRNELINEKNRYTSLLLNKGAEILSSQKELEKYAREEMRLRAEVEQIEQNLKELAENCLHLETETRSLQEQCRTDESFRSEILSKIQKSRDSLIQQETRKQVLDQDFLTHPYRKGTQAILNGGFPGIKGVVGLLFKYSDTVAPWVESVLGHKLNSLVFETLAEAQQAIQWLKENQAGRAHCFVLERIPTVQPLDLRSSPNANSLCAFVHCAPEVEKLKNYIFGSAFLKEQTLYDTGMIDGGSDISSSQAQAGTEEKNPFLQKEKLVQDIDQIQKELDQLQKENESRQNRLTEQQLSFNEKKSALDKQALQKNMAQEIWNKKNEELSLSVREKQVLQEKLDQDKKEQCEHQQALQLIEAKLENLQSDQRKREEERTELERQIEEKRQEEHRFELRAKEAEIRLESFLENVRRNEESLEEWRNRLEEISHNVQDAEEEIEVFREQCLRMGKIQKDETLKIQNLQSEKTKVSAETESILKRKNELESLVWATQETVQKCRETQKTLSEISHGAELELRTSENEKKNILNRLQDNYQLTLESAQEQFPLNPVDAEEIARLKKRVESLSHSVNLEAPEQYKSLQERYQFLDTQMQDLQKAKEDLRSAIQQINHTTREQFKQTFAKVQENFKTVYSQLFEGGVANLIFTDPENILDSGIDIVAQPAGKKLQNIALLSGGEKTLTAIALLFAFFMVKPSPTCILDEVDAPLDPANVNRYLSLLKEFAQKTQFIAVTHNAKTMESADILYGVTMEESGVSRLLSVRLKKENSQTSVALLPA